MNNDISPLLEKLGNKYNFTDKIIESGYKSIFDIIRTPRNLFLAKYNSEHQAADIYDTANSYAIQIARKFRQQHYTHHTYARNYSSLSLKGGPQYQSLFQDNWQQYCPNGAPEANNSPVAYLAEIYKLAMDIELNAEAEAIKIDKRRPDLAHLILDDVSINQEITTLSLVNTMLSQRLEDTLKQQGKANLSSYDLLTNVRYPFQLPYDYAQNQINLTFDNKKLFCLDMMHQTDKSYPYFIKSNLNTAHGEFVVPLANQLGTSQQKIINEPLNPSNSQFYQDNYGVNNEKLLELLSTFTTQTSLSVAEVEQLLCIKGISTNKGAALEQNNVRLSQNVRNLNIPAAPYSYGAVFINGPNAKESDFLHLYREFVSNVNLPQEVNKLSGVNHGRFDRLNRMIRLWKWMRLPVDKIDLLVTATMRAEGDKNKQLQMNDNTLRMLGIFHHWSKKYHISPDDFAALIYQITPFSTGVATPFFDQIFNSSALFDAPLVIDDSEFYSETKQDDIIISKLCVGLKIEAKDFALLAPLVAESMGKKSLTCSLLVISAFYRIVQLSRILGLTPQEGVVLLTLIGGNKVLKQVAGIPYLSQSGNNRKTDILDIMIAMEQATEWLAKNKLSVGTLQLFLLPENEVVMTGNAAQVAFINQVGLHRNSESLTLESLSSNTLPALDNNGDLINWLTPRQTVLNAVSHQKYGLVKPDVNITDEINKAIKSILLDEKVKVSITAQWAAIIIQTQSAQNAISASMLANAFQLSQPFPLFILNWIGTSSYDFLLKSFELFDNKNLQPEVIDQDYLILMYDLSRYIAVIKTFQLSTVMLNHFSEHPEWFGCQNTQLSLSVVYYFSRYRDWMQLAAPLNNAEDKILRYLQLVNTDGKNNDKANIVKILTELLSWQRDEVLLANSYVVGKEDNTAKTLAEIDTMMRLKVWSEEMALSMRSLLATININAHSSYEDYKQVGIAMISTL
ncbi:Tc toxin subunit A [Photorhabdus sp. APURE]|uniref:Tc toxin subunit A n=1 Tax=Photorhabdus aballayi TaxID=2991723 RepID=UPI00223DE30B|nr:Tc toxin subunit A [Photorhabdus aballayi]MCW7546855.1 Tc toxin subunit A [Photorhabdus aballayi]